MNHLKQLREAAGLTQFELAVKAGLNLSAITQIESGRRRSPRIDTCRAIAVALGVTVDDIWPTTPDESGAAEVRSPA